MVNLPNKEDENQKVLRQLLEKKDHELYLNYDKKQYKLVSKRRKWILYENNWIRVNRRYYFDRIAKKYKCLLDEKLKIEKYQHITNEERQYMFEMVAENKMTFSQVRKAYKNRFSTCTIHNLIKRHSVNNYSSLIINPELFPFIFIDIDDTFQNLRVNNKKSTFRFRIIHFYQFFDSERKKFINEIKMVVVTKCNGFEINDKEQITNKINEVITKNYGNKDKFQILVSSDGARNLKKIAEYFNAIHAIDKYHVFNRIYLTFRTSQLITLNWMLNDQNEKFSSKINLRKEILELVKNYEVDSAILRLNEIKKNSFTQCYSLNSLIKYLQNNKTSIETWKNVNYTGTYTETYVQQLVKSYFGNVGRCFSKDIFTKMLAANCLVF